MSGSVKTTHFKLPEQKQLGTTKKQPEKLDAIRTQNQICEIRSRFYDHLQTIDYIAHYTKRRREYVEDVVYYRIESTSDLLQPCSVFDHGRFPRERR